LDNNSDGAALRFPSGGAPEMMRRVVPWWCASGFRFQLSEKSMISKKKRLIGWVVLGKSDAAAGDDRVLCWMMGWAFGPEEERG
jgi:hypothetical protein